MENAWHHLQDIFSSSIGIALACIVIAAGLWFARSVLGWKGPLELVGLVEEWLGLKPHASEPRQTVNVEYRSADDGRMDFGGYVVATMQNGRGRALALRDGVFNGGDPVTFKVGARVRVTVQDGLARERLVIEVDLDAQTLYVKSQYTRAAMIAKLTHTTDPLAA